ncbi:MAG: M61 family metallopeptidase, partial [Bradymonadaceae bacterium]
WRLDGRKRDRATVEYQIYAHRLNVREKHVDDSHVFFQPTAVFLYPDGQLDQPVELTLDPPREEWTVYCGLEPVGDDPHRFRAPDFDTLYDMPVEMGDHDEVHLTADGVDHTVAFWGEGNWDGDRLKRDIPKIVEANASMFDGVPYDDYTFITLLSDGAYGGLEHRNSTSLIYPQNEFGDVPDDRDDEPPVTDDDYLNFLSLVAHEHFHVWNVKRIFPQAIEDFDYQTENYVRDLWTIEGTTSFYDRMTLLRAGLIDADRFLEFFADRIAKYESIPGRAIDSLRDAGMDAWIKHYRPDENTINATASYYLKGALVTCLLDLRIRRESDGEHGLDDLMRHLWEEFGRETDRGYPDGYYETVASELAGTDLTEFFDRYVRGTAELDWESALEPIGLALHRNHSDDAAPTWLGLRTRAGDSGREIRDVRADSPSHDGGLSPGDDIVAIDGWRVDPETDLEERLALFEPGDTVEVHLFRRNRLVARDVELQAPPADDYVIRRRPDATDEQLSRLRDWLGTDDISLPEEDGSE